MLSKKFILTLALACAVSNCSQKKSVIVFTIDEMPVCASSVEQHKATARKFADGKIKSLPVLTEIDYLDLCECVELLETGYSANPKN